MESIQAEARQKAAEFALKERDTLLVAKREASDPGASSLPPHPSRESLDSSSATSHTAVKRRRRRSPPLVALGSATGHTSGPAGGDSSWRRGACVDADGTVGWGGAADGSRRAFYREFARVVESADVILHVLDARDPLGCRCVDVERYIVKRNPEKKIILMLNKIGACWGLDRHHCREGGAEHRGAESRATSVYVSPPGCPGSSARQSPSPGHHNNSTRPPASPPGFLPIPSDPFTACVEPRRRAGMTSTLSTSFMGPSSSIGRVPSPPQL